MPVKHVFGDLAIDTAHFSNTLVGASSGPYTYTQ